MADLREIRHSFDGIHLVTAYRTEMMRKLDNNTLRVAVIGLGKMGLLHTSILNVMPNVEVVGLVEKSTILTMLFKKIFAPTGAIVVNDFEALSEMGLDAVYVTTPISSHSHIIGDLFKQQITKNIFVEKTLASDYAHARELCGLARNCGSITMVGYMKRFSVVFGKAKELLNQKALGKPQSFRAYAYSSDFPIGVKSKSSSSRGGALRDIGCHVIDLALWLFGDLDFCDLVSPRDGFLPKSSVSFAVKNSSGLTGHFDVSQAMLNYRMPEFGLSIDCANGKLQVNDDRVVLVRPEANVEKWYRTNLNDNVSFFLGETEYFREDQLFVDSLLNKRKCEPDFNTAAKVDYLIDQVEKEMTNFE